jgi:hypothetical protein
LYKEIININRKKKKRDLKILKEQTVREKGERRRRREKKKIRREIERS